MLLTTDFRISNLASHARLTGPTLLCQPVDDVLKVRAIDSVPPEGPAVVHLHDGMPFGAGPMLVLLSDVVDLAPGRELLLRRFDARTRVRAQALDLFDAAVVLPVGQ